MRGTTTKRSSLALVAGVVAALTVVVGVVLLADMRAEAQDETLQHETKFTFFNDTATVASDLHLAFGEPVKAVVVDVIGSTCPPIAASDIPAGPIIDIDWGVKCVENDGLTSVSVTVLSAGEEDPAHPEVLWTKDASITPEPTPTGATPTDVIPLPSLPPSTATDIGPPPTIPITTQVPPVHTATPTTPSSGPTSTVGPTATPTATPHTPTPTATSTPTATNTVMPTITPTPTLAPGNGDVSCNGAVDAIDAALLLQLIAQLLPTLQCQFAADVNLNGVIDSIDAALLLQFVAHLIPSLPTGP